MNKPDNNYSRLNRKKGGKQSDKILNILIAVVVLAIIVTASFIFINGSDKEKVEENPIETTDNETDEDAASEGSDDNELEDADVEDEAADTDDESINNNDADDAEKTDENPGVVKYESSEDAVVDETIINTGWEPIGTSQTGEHTSLYDGESTDWLEKISAIAYATGHPEDALIIWKIKNGGTPQKSIGIVSTKDKVEKYRVYLEWVDEKGWKPVKMDVLNTLDFKY